MNLLERVLTLLRANIDTLIEKAEDPQIALRQLQLDMRNQLVQVKTQVATAIASVYQLQRRRREKQAEAEHWLKKAEDALQQGDEEAARAAMSHYIEMRRLIERFEQQLQEQERFVDKMRDVLQRLEARINEIESTIELLAHRQRQVLIQQRVLEALHQSGSHREAEGHEQARSSRTEAEAQARPTSELPASGAERARRRPHLASAAAPSQGSPIAPSRAAAELRASRQEAPPSSGPSNASELAGEITRQGSLSTARPPGRSSDTLSAQPSPELSRLLEILKAARLKQNEV